MVDVWLILVFGLCILWLQNGIIGSKWVRVQTYFWWKQRSGIEFLFRRVKVFRLFISRRGDSLRMSASGGMRRAEKECSAGWMCWLFQQPAAQGWLCHACHYWECSGAFWTAVQNVSLWECYGMGLMGLILVFPFCLRCKRRQFLILEKYKYRIYCWLEVLRPSRTFSHKLLG